MINLASVRDRGLSLILSAVRRLGFLNGLLYLVARSIESISQGRWRLIKYYFFAQPIPEKPILKSGRSDAVRVEIITAADSIVSQFPRPPAVIGQRFARGALCFVARRYDRFIGYLWLKHQGYEEDEVRCLFLPMPEDQAVWDFDVLVEPEFRLSRAFVRLWDRANQYLRERDVRWSVCRISAFNTDSLRAHARFGLKRLGSALFLCFGKVQLSFFTSNPYVHLSLDGVSRPIYHLRVPQTMTPERNS